MGAVKATAEKNSTPSVSRAEAQRQPFVSRAGDGDFFQRVQPKMTVGKPGDKFEQEADKAAGNVMRMSEPQAAAEGMLQRRPDDKIQMRREEQILRAAADEARIQRRREEQILCAPEEKIQKAEMPPERREEQILRAPVDEVRKMDPPPGRAEEQVMRAAGGGRQEIPGTVQSAMQSNMAGGEPLASDVREFMEPRFGADFSAVRVHRDADAASLSNQLSARAFTYQNHIFFARGQYQPGTSEGKHLLAHELTHTIQQGHSVRTSPEVQQAPAAPAKPPSAVSSEVVKITSNTFEPSQKVKDEIKASGSQGLDVRVVVNGLTSEGSIKIRARKKEDSCDSTGIGSMPLLNPWTQKLGGMYVNFRVANSAIAHGYASLKPGGANSADWLDTLKKDASLLGGLGLKIEKLPKHINTFDNAKLTLGVSDFKVEVGGFLDANFNLSVEDMNTPKVDADANVNIKGIVEGKLHLDNNSGPLAGQISLAISYKSFAGNADVKYNADGTVDVGGKAAYNSDKLSGEISFVATDAEAADRFAKDAIAAAGGKENVQEAGPPAPVPAPKPTSKKRSLAAAGQLQFNLTQWFAGTVHVVVDSKGAVTVIGKIAPPAEIELFKQHDWDDEIIKLEAKAYYGIPVVGNLNLFANVSLHAIAKLGPAKIYNIEILGTYSTDPEIQKSIQISGSINISAYGGLRLRAEGGAGIEILEHDLKFGVGINADVGVKAYADARPTIGYRDPGVFYISGTLEIVAQPVLGLGGDFFIAVETPWWSPLSDHRWTWPLFSKEWPLGDPIGISAAVKDYELGSGKVPEIEMKKPEFDPSKFMTNMVDDKLPDKAGGEGAGHGTFKEDGSVPPPVVPPKKPAPKVAAAKPPKKGAQPKAGKSATPDPAAAKGKQVGNLFDQASKPLAALKTRGAMTRGDLNNELAKIKAQVPGISFDVKHEGDKWMVTPKAGGQAGKSLALPAKDVSEKDKHDGKDERSEEKKHADKSAAIAEAEKLVHVHGFDEKAVRAKLPPIKSHHRLLTLDLKVDSDTADEEVIHFSASASSEESGKRIKIEKDAIKETKFTQRTGTLAGDTVGMEMTIDWLGAKHKEGSPPKSGVQDTLMGLLVTDPTESSESKFIRGHLLNEHLGGEGDANNLFPLTGNANSQHLHSTESKIKNWVKEKNRWVFYNVRVDNVSKKLDLSGPKKNPKNYVNCTFVCTANQKDAAGEIKDKLSTQIHSKYNFKGKAQIDVPSSHG